MLLSHLLMSTPRITFYNIKNIIKILKHNSNVTSGACTRKAWNFKSLNRPEEVRQRFILGLSCFFGQYLSIYF